MARELGQAQFGAFTFGLALGSVLLILGGLGLGELVAREVAPRSLPRRRPRLERACAQVGSDAGAAGADRGGQLPRRLLRRGAARDPDHRPRRWQRAPDGDRVGGVPGFRAPTPHRHRPAGESVLDRCVRNRRAARGGRARGRRLHRDARIPARPRDGVHPHAAPRRPPSPADRSGRLVGARADELPTRGAERARPDGPPLERDPSGAPGGDGGRGRRLRRRVPPDRGDPVHSMVVRKRGAAVVFPPAG